MSRRLEEAARLHAEAKNRSLVVRCAADIAPEAIEWLWHGRLAKGKHTAVAGEPGVGKSQLLLYCVAALTKKSGTWPNGDGRAPRGKVVLLSAEDGAADTIVPRLMALGADLRLIHIISAVRTEGGKGVHTFSLQADLDVLEAKITELGEVLMVGVDPISSYFGPGLDSHKNVDVRGVLEPVSEMAERLRVAILSVTHFSKANSGTSTKALHKFMGSIAFVAAPRVAFVIMDDPDDKGRRLFLPAKNNLTAPSPGLAYRLEQTHVGIGNIPASKVVWEPGMVLMTADEAVAATHKSRTPALDEAKDFLQGLLTRGALPTKEVLREATAAGISHDTTRRAKEALKIRVSKDGMGPWVWTLPQHG